MRFLDAHAVAALGPAAAVQAIIDALRGGLDPAADPARVTTALTTGQFLIMPSETATAAGVKVATVAPDNPIRGLPRIQATYLLFDRDTLTLRAALDGTALTTLRTPAVSVAAVLTRLPETPLRVAVLGAGPQATAHVATLAAVRPLEDTTYLVRAPSRTPLDALALSSPQASQALQSADVVVCATSARTPIFDSALLRDDAVVIAVGSHEPDAREVDAGLLGRATVVVEDTATALREAGDVILAIDDGAIGPTDLLPMRDVVTGASVVPTDRPMVFKSVGMSWQDLVVAEAVVRRTPIRDRVDQGQTQILSSSFGGAAAAYAEHRPDYAQEAVRWSLEGAAGPRVLDLGAGTGKLTATLVTAGVDVVAVEPDPAMLAELRRALPAVRALSGSAESIPLPNGSVDAVVAGHAMHWFDMAVAGPEIARVLTPSGILAGLWNVIDDSVDWVAGLAQIGGSAAIGARDLLSSWRAATARTYLPNDGHNAWFGSPEQVEFPHEQRHTVDSLVAKIATHAGLLVMPEHEREATLGRIRDFLTSRPETADGEFALPMLTGVLRVQRLDATARSSRGGGSRTPTSR